MKPITLYVKFISHCMKNLKMSKDEAKKAWKNTNPRDREYNLGYGIQSMFVWSETPEGYNFWREICNRKSNFY